MRRPATRIAATRARHIRRNPSDEATRLSQCVWCGDRVGPDARPVNEGYLRACATCASAHENDCYNLDHRNELWSAMEGVYVTPDGGQQRWCGTCVARDTAECWSPDCPANATLDALICVEGRAECYCPACLDYHATWCPVCEGYRFNEDMREVQVRDERSGSLSNELWCINCCGSSRLVGGRVLPQAVYCDECRAWYSPTHEHEPRRSPSRTATAAESPDAPVVASYHGAQGRIPFTPHESDWTRAQPKPLYFGVELEVFIPPNAPGVTRTKADREPYARQVLDSIGPKFGDFLYDIQHDGSLGYSGLDGFETITQPCGLDTHREYWSQANLAGLLTDHPHQPEHFTAGLHVHISKSAMVRHEGGFSGRYPVLGYMLRFLSKAANKPFVEAVARRSFNRFAMAVVRGEAMEGLSHRSDHYHVLNFSGSKTAEFRLPKSTKHVTTILATLEFTFLLLRFCESLMERFSADSTELLRKLTVAQFKKFIAEDHWRNDSRFLRPYLVERGLATPREMKLSPIPGGEPVRSNPAQLPDPDEIDDTPGPYLRRALTRYRRSGEQS